MASKVCRKCKTEKPVEEFYVRPRNTGPVGKGVRSDCKSCASAGSKEYNRQRYVAHREEVIRAQRVANYKRLYGITIEQYEAMLAAQDGKCAICPATEPGGKRVNFIVDHCHKTRLVRGLLCHNCNVLLGHANDSIERLRRAIAYLVAAQPEVEAACG